MDRVEKANMEDAVNSFAAIADELADMNKHLAAIVRAMCAREDGCSEDYAYDRPKQRSTDKQDAEKWAQFIGTLPQRAKEAALEKELSQDTKARKAFKWFLFDNFGIEISEVDIEPISQHEHTVTVDGVTFRKIAHETWVSVELVCEHGQLRRFGMVYDLANLGSLMAYPCACEREARVPAYDEIPF